MTQEEAQELIVRIQYSMPAKSVQASLIKKNTHYSVQATLLSEHLIMSIFSPTQWKAVKAAWSLYVPVFCDWCRAVIPAEQGQYVTIHQLSGKLISGEQTVCRTCVRTYRDAYYKALEASA